MFPLKRYLIATTLVYFGRLRLQGTEFSPANFFLLLFLANDMEEDLDFKHEILPFALGKEWRCTFGAFQKAKEILWARMNYRNGPSYICKNFLASSS